MDIVHILNVAHKEAVRCRRHFLAYLIGMALIEAREIEMSGEPDGERLSGT
ncbi:hypothetical protein [Oricola cellulosilytica]|uniref:hypothetical protein n=1 Tax=Oricola cellulosilytica TaxID=1429082 RepID=UPI001304B6D3|nr:hypothetical protein [Oricola cellulosilytica]